MRALIMAVSILLVSCGGGAGDEARRAADERETAFDPLVEQLDKARAVEETLEKQKRELDEALQKAEEGDESP